MNRSTTAAEESVVEPQVATILRSLSPEEIDMLRDAFIYMDRDSDGFLSEQELMAQVEASVGPDRYGPLREYLTPLFGVADKDGDGRLSLTEFLMSFADGPGVVPAEVINRCVAQVRVRLTDEEISTLQENFRRMDRNGDGFLDKDELELALREHLLKKFPDLTDANFQEIVTVVIATADTDHDGKLALSEFIRSFQEDQGVLPAAFVDTGAPDAGLRELSREETQVLREAFGVLDKDNDGYVDFMDMYNSLWEALASRIEDQSQIRDLCDLIMATADRMKSGRLTLSEFIRSFLQNMDLMLIPVAAAQEKLRSACLKLQQMLDSGELEKLVMIFNDLDRNGDGYLDRAELVSVLRQLFQDAFPDWDAETLTSVMTAIVLGAETHHNGRLSLEEFIRSFVDGPGVMPPEVVHSWESYTSATQSRQGTVVVDEEQRTVQAALYALQQNGDTQHNDGGCQVSEAALRQCLRDAFGDDDATKLEEMWDFVLSHYAQAVTDGVVWLRPIAAPVEDDSVSAAVAVPSSSSSKEGAPSKEETATHDAELPGDGEGVVMIDNTNVAKALVAPVVDDQSTSQAQDQTRPTDVVQNDNGDDDEPRSHSRRGVNNRPTVTAVAVELATIVSHPSAIDNDSPLAGEGRVGDDEGEIAVHVHSGMADSADSAIDEARSSGKPQAARREYVSAAADQDGASDDVAFAAAAPVVPETTATQPAEVLLADRTSTSRPHSTTCKSPAAPGSRGGVYGYDGNGNALYEDELWQLFKHYDVEDRDYLDRATFKQQYLRMEQYGVDPLPFMVDAQFSKYARGSDRIYFDEFCILMLQRVRM